MTLSEVLYEAACDMSLWHDPDFPSCWLIEELTGTTKGKRPAYEAIMSPLPGHPWDHLVHHATAELGWSVRDFRTFMLLMAAEAVR